MAGSMRLVFCSGIVGAIALGGAALAQTLSADSSVAEARIAWAKRHVEMVCRPLEAQRLSARAAKCYEEVSLFIADARRPIPPSVAAVEPKPVAKPVVAAVPAVVKPVVVAKPAGVAKPVVVAKSAEDKLTPKAAPKRVASRVRPSKKRFASKPVVVASNERVATALAAAQDSVNVKRCGSLPCYRFTTILGVGF